MANNKDTDTDKNNQDAIDKIAGLAAIQNARREHDKQQHDQGQPAKDILDKDK